MFGCEVIYLINRGVISPMFRSRVEYFIVSIASIHDTTKSKLTSYFCNKLKTWRNSVTYGTPCYAIGHFVFWYNHVTYRTPCHASGHLVTASATDLRERFLLSGVFYLTFLPAGFKASLGAGSSTSRLARLHANLRNIAPVRLFV